MTALLVVSLILLNSAAVTAITSERDSRALDLLLVTDLSPKEIVFGKLLGAFYNGEGNGAAAAGVVRVFVVLPSMLSTEQLVFLLGGWVVMTLFAATLGLHAGITYANSRTAIATSIGTLLFLFLGVATCMRMMLAFNVVRVPADVVSRLHRRRRRGAVRGARLAESRRKRSSGRRWRCRSPRSS